MTTMCVPIADIVPAYQIFQIYVVYLNVLNLVCPQMYWHIVTCIHLKFLNQVVHDETNISVLLDLSTYKN